MFINICNNIMKNNIDTVIVISCNNKSFERDYNCLSKNYKIIERIKLLYVNIIILENGVIETTILTHTWTHT